MTRLSTYDEAPGSRRFSLPEPGQERVFEAFGVCVDIDGRRILDEVTFWIPRGEFVCLCGPNGAGKSTFLKTALGLRRPTKGEIRVLGRPPERARGLVGYVPQRRNDARFPGRAVELIVANLRGRWPLFVREHEREAARSALARVGGERLLDASLAGLSGGETQRVFLARALVTSPSLIVLDEPTAGVDAVGRAELIELMAEISASDELAAILVTHNLAAVARCAERIVYLDQGRVVAWGLPRSLLGHERLELFRTSDEPDAPSSGDE